MKRMLLVLLALLGMVGFALPSRADLDAYLKKPEPVYKWEKRSETKVDGGTIYDIHLVSQTWQGIVWEHRLQIIRLDNIAHPHFCALLNTGGNGSNGDTQLGLAAAKSCGGVFAILYNIPNQPLYDGKSEDALIAYTWKKFLETGDESWPLHFPMAKAVLKAMDAVQEFTKEAGQPSVDEFLITGASKRGWTTWLAGASQDKRIKAIAPMVIDTLNLPAQKKHELEVYGKPSEQQDDYTKAGLQGTLNSKAGKRLGELEDPYSYRDRLTLPKLIVLGTNDRYWTQDSLNLYWDGLKGQKWVLYNPNVGHGLEALDAQLRVLSTVGAFANAVASKTPWPQMKWEYKANKGGADLVVNSTPAPKSGKLYSTTAETQDFRDSKWTARPMEAANGGVSGHLDAPAKGYAAMYGELTYEVGGKTFVLCTQIHIQPAAPAAAAVVQHTAHLSEGICPEEDKAMGRPAVNAGRPTITDPAALTAPGWLEAELGVQKNLDRDRNLGTPLLLKLTDRNQRLQYRLSTDGYVNLGDANTSGFGDTYAALQYLFTTQAQRGFDVAGRATVKIPTANASIGTGKFDYGLMLLASKDFTPNLHGDFNVGLSSLSRQGAVGTDTQFMATASFTIPLKGGHWAYTNELVYSSPLNGVRASLTTMHGLTYAVNRSDVYDVAMQWQLYGGGANWEVLFGRTFMLGKVL